MIRFSKQTSELRSSAIRDLMGIASDKEIISFAGGMPDNELFPLEETDTILQNLSTTKKQAAFQYGPTAGLPSLMESLSGFLERKGLPVQSNRLLITTGSLQAINILGKIFIDAGDTVLVENPCFIGALSAFKSYGAQLSGIPVDAEGISIFDLKNNLKAETLPKFLYITPYFHNPAGITYSVERKNHLIQALKNKNVPLIEDDAYSDLFFYEEDKERLKPVKAIDPEGIDVCYTGSFSKIFGPGLRLGWMLVPDEIYKKCELVKQAIDACSPSISQVMADEFIRSGLIYEYINRVRLIYKERAEAMTSALQEFLPDFVEWTPPRGGFYLWLTLPENCDADKILKESIPKGVVFIVGKTFDPEGQKNNCIRLSYSNTSEEKIRKGIEILAKVIVEHCR